MTHVTHLHKSGAGLASMTACGRNVLRTPFAMNWEKYKNENPKYRCAKCDASKQFALNKKMDERKSA
jgi:hypothetical protein